MRAQVRVQAACSERLDDQFCDTTMRAITRVDVANDNRADDAVARGIAMVKSLRTTRASKDSKPEPVGVVVTAGIDLKGLRGEAVRLS